MATTIPGSESDYFYATYDRSKDAAIGCRPMVINSRIMPLRSTGAGMGIDSKRCMRGVDVMFLAEAVATRQAIVTASGGQPSSDTLAVTPEIKSSRLIDIRNCMAQQWNLWAMLSDVGYGGFGGVNLGDSRMARDPLLVRLRNEIGFSSGIGTMTPVPQFTELLMEEVQNLFTDIGKKQCCVIPLIGATYTVGGNNDNVLAYLIGREQEPDVHEYHANEASTVVVTHAFPPAAAGSKVMLFAYSGGRSWKANNYPSDQENGVSAFCLVPTDGEWHEVSSDGTLTAVLDAKTIANNIVSACNFADPKPEVPPDDGSSNNRQASWSYFLMSSLNNTNAVTFFALFDLKHTNIGSWL